ncbi:PaaX family transcriptional regulator [Kocuria dechangensis]|uniref:PaaX family transcriptional regulator n=1 Tax=Kocuria dechangensis TaxID=1176249 RepID=A0A917GXJ1_9MICC|nr:PaaX family transcriptional regulator C-terminal domain-containing protein [Kocuria dechangensis]GGG60535.1 PaaX family transcriptional regulator [Kocuria dechangensis]
MTDIQEAVDTPAPHMPLSFSPSARSLLRTVLGEMVWKAGRDGAWTASIVETLGHLGVAEQAARQAIARAAAAGWIEQERHGRSVRWRLTPRANQMFREGSARIRSLADPFGDWDGQWALLLITIPHTHRAARKKLYAGLGWAGFGNPAPGVWISPHPGRTADVAGLIAELDLADNTMSLIGHPGTVGLSTEEVIHRAWDLEELRVRYERFLEWLPETTPATDAELLRQHLLVTAALQRVPAEDPQLPEAVLPGWIGRRVAARCEELRHQWQSDVQETWRQLEEQSQL